MHNEDYIASGVLELYAAGALDAAERMEVERMAAESPEVRAALLDACEVMEQYAMLHAAQPNPALKDKVMARIQQGQRVSTEEGPEAWALYPEPEEQGSGPYKWMFAASIVLFLLSGFMSLRFYQNWQDAETRLAQALASEQQLAQTYQTAAYSLDQQEQMLRVLRDESYQPVRLQGVEAHPEAKVLVYWNPEEEKVYIDAVQLPAPPAGKQYQLWALLDGKPIDAGLISLERGQETAMQQMKGIKNAQAFAVTLEPVGGSANPTLEQLYVMGEVKS
ncbi:anti-sigma factor [Pontibacter russatus]|uniref:anti-sigma factor n=1 Tax=Pontibacter russatus TaxID=2694929 RepID=UPI00137B8535|nr:anti-sigma factor [Pontibacter russatus]